MGAERAEQLASLWEEQIGLGLGLVFFLHAHPLPNGGFFGLAWEHEHKAPHNCDHVCLKSREKPSGWCASLVINTAKAFPPLLMLQKLFQPQNKEPAFFFPYLYTPSSRSHIVTYSNHTQKLDPGAQWYITSILVKQSICSMWLRACFKNAILFRPTVAPHKVFCSHAFLWDDRAYPRPVTVGACGFFPSSAECCSD